MTPNFFFAIDSIDLTNQDNLAIMLRCAYLGAAQGYFTDRFVRDMEAFVQDKACA